MSYDLHLCDGVSGEILHLDTPHQMKGGTYALGGTTECSLNITYNYSNQWGKAFGENGHVRQLYGMSGVESIPILEKAISHLKDDFDDDYWKSTEGNAKRALIQLLTLAKLRPDGIWNGD